MTRVRLVGSRARGDPTELSDWDFAVETEDFEALAGDLPRIADELDPIGHGWDPLSVDETTYMLMFPGPTKVDWIFDRTRKPDPPWRVDAATLPAVDYHFWDWILWLAAKRARGHDELVAAQLATMHEHLLGPLGVETAPRSVEDAVQRYVEARARVERQLGVTVSRRLQKTVEPALAPR